MKNLTFINCKWLVPLVVFLLLSIGVKAQQTLNKDLDSLITNKINWYGIKKQSPTLFIHFDKTVYVGNENVWFTGYFLNLINPVAYKTLSIALIKDDSHTVIVENKFIISKGLVFGNMLIPDTIPAGNYSFIAYANHLLNGEADVLFTQRISKKNSNELAFSASFNPIDTSAARPQQKVMLLVNFAELKNPPRTVPVNYYVGNSAHPVLKGSANTQMGQYIFNIPSKLLTPGNNRLHAQLKVGTETTEVGIDLPLPVNTASVRFYPEGGNLVNNVKNTIGWEVKRQDNSPVRIKARLYQDKKIIDTIETNNYGLGRFTLTPKAGSDYYVKISNINKKDTVYKLPVAISSVPQITVSNAVANNVLVVSTRSEQRQKLYFIVHNYRQVFSDTAIEMTTPLRRVVILLNGIPKGLTQLTVTDSLGHPFAARLFFAHYNKRPELNINADQDNYKTRQKVTLKVKLNNTEFPDSGLVSIACVQQSRFEANKQNDIESYFYLKHDLGDLPFKENYLGYADADKRYLEDLLLIKGWRRYTWTDMLKTTPADTALKFKDLTFNGRVVRFGDKLKEPVKIINFNHPVDVVTTNNEGGFVLNDQGKRIKNSIVLLNI